MHFTINFIAITCYLIAAFNQGRYLFSRTEAAPRRGALLVIGGIASLAHAISVGGIIYDGIHIDLGFFKVSSLIAWFIALACLLSLLRRPTNNLIVALFPLAALCIILSSIEGPSHEMSGQISPGILMHIISSILAYSFITMAALQATILAFQERHLKHHHLGGLLRRLPPLQTMERLLFELIWIGTSLLSLSLLSGILFIEDMLAQHLVHKTFFSVLAWVIFIILLVGRYRLGWRGKTAVRWTFGGFFALMLGYFGSKFVLELLLNSHG